MAPPDQRASKAIAKPSDRFVVHGFAPEELAGEHFGLYRFAAVLNIVETTFSRPRPPAAGPKLNHSCTV
jgi:hypothetical protein